MSGTPTTGLALAKSHPFVPHHMNANVAVILIIIASVNTTSNTNTLLGPLLSDISASFTSSFSSALLHMHFHVACDFSLIARLVKIGKQMRFSTIKSLGGMLELPCSMMAAGDVPGVGGI